VSELKKIEGKYIYRGKIINLRVDRVSLPSGRETIREVVEYRGSVAILPLFENGDVLLLKQFRYPVGEELIEIPAGKIEEGEDPRFTAERELEEETGYRAAEMEKIASFYLAPGYSTEEMHLFVARDLQKSSTNPDFDEIIEPFRAGKGEIEGLLKEGRIKDAKTLLALYYYLLEEGS